MRRKCSATNILPIAIADVQGLDAALNSKLSANLNAATVFNGIVRHVNVTADNTTYIVQSIDAMATLYIDSSANAISIVFPNSLPVGFTCSIRQIGNNDVSVTTDGTYNNFDGHTLLAGLHAFASVEKGVNGFTLTGQTKASE